MRSHVLLAAFGGLVVLALLHTAAAGTMGVARAQITPWPVRLTMTGPATAVSGQEVSYRVDYQLLDPVTVSQTSFQISIPRNTTYVSSEVVSGPEGILSRLEEGFFVGWAGLGNAEETEGAVEITVNIDPEFVGVIATQALEPGTFTAVSNIVETQVFAPGMLPEAGGGGAVAGSGLRVAPALLALSLVGAALLCAGAATRIMRRAI